MASRLIHFRAAVLRRFYPGGFRPAAGVWWNAG
jgi:hypothetical protein